MSGRGVLLSAALGLLALPPVAMAVSTELATNVESGFKAEKAYEVGEVDNINLFNGNLVIRLPLGPSLPIGPSLGLQAVLTYNAHPWDYEEIGTQPILVPARGMNAGMGWKLSWGELFKPNDPVNPLPNAWLYIDPSGGQHSFAPKLHPGEPTVAGVFYSQDSTYLRLKIIDTGATVESADGTVSKFGPAPGDIPPIDALQLRLMEVKDAFGNGYQVTYAGPTTGERRWELTDLAIPSRKIVVRFDTTVGGYYQSRGGVVSNVEVPAVGGTAVWQFDYAVKTIYGNCTASAAGTFQVPFLARVQLPGLQAWEMAKPDVDWGYRYWQPPNPPSPASECFKGGLLQHLRLPTKGFYEYEWTHYTFPAPTSEDCKDFFQKPAGVAVRRIKKRGGGLLGAWNYSQEMIGTQPSCGNASGWPITSKTTMTSPLGQKTESFFSLKFDASEYGLPRSHESGVGGTSSWGISTKVFDSGYQSGSNPIRTTYLRYEQDGAPGQDDANQRVAAQRTVYHDDGNVEATSTASRFDGFGHYRRTTLGGTFGSGGNVRAEEMLYNPTYADYPNQGAGSSSTDWPDTSPWVLGNAMEKTVCEGATLPACSGGQLAKEQLCFEAETGLLSRRRVFAAVSPGASDLLSFFNHSGGFVTREQDYGGDTQALATVNDLCSLTLPTSNSYRIDSTYSSKALSSVQWKKDDDSSLPFKSLQRTIHAATGLAISALAPDGRETKYDYDLLGRLTFVKPQDGLSTWTQYNYSPATYDPVTQVGAQANVAVLRRANGANSGSTYLAESSVTFDDLGRVYREFEAQPDDIDNRRETIYNANSWKESVSELNTAGVAAAKTLFTNYDAFGRPKAITTPDGHVTQLAYTGDRLVARTVKIGTRRVNDGPIEENDSTTTETYDRQGRLAKVTEPSGTGGANTTTTYGYDEGGRLVSVATAGQNRAFDYDGRGFLTSETHPEKGTSGNGSVNYSSYDARGHVGKKVDGDVQLGFTYDRAERLLSIVDLVPNPDRPFKDFTYDSASGGTYAKSKLVATTRHNWVRPVDAAPGAAQVDTLVTETLTYGAANGAVSQRATSVTGGPTFQQSWTYNALGEVASLSYPRCTTAPCSSSVASAGPARAVNLAYTQGRLTAVSQSLPSAAAVGDFTYHPNAMIWQVTHGNGIIDTTTNDLNQMQRPNSISTSAASVVLGPYKYDGAGNITDIGANQMRYDLVSRLVDFKFDAGQRQTYLYDLWGNLTQIKTVPGVTQNFTIQGTTNRISGLSYDKAGNQTTSGTNYTHLYDAFNQMINFDGDGNDETYYYTAGDERIVSIHYNVNLGFPAGKTATYRLRDLDGLVLAESTLTGSDTTAHWAWKKDYVYRDGLLLASFAPANTTWHYTLDHLGTPRLITDQNGDGVSDHHYYPYGQELVAQTDDVLKFTGHERDFNTTSGTADDLDYMHARSHSPVIGRFLSVDPGTAKTPQPQSWNHYTYALGNPVKYFDPDGKESRHEIAFNNEAQAVAEGRMSTAEFKEHINARGGGAAVGAGLVTGYLGVEAGLLHLAVNYPTIFGFLSAAGAALTDQPKLRVTVPGPTNSPYGKIDYLLGLVTGNQGSAGKGNTFASTLGFSENTLGPALVAHLTDNIRSADINGNTITVTAVLTGPTGSSRTVRSVWQVLEDGTIAFVTAFEKRKK